MQENDAWRLHMKLHFSHYPSTCIYTWTMQTALCMHAHPLCIFVCQRSRSTDKISSLCNLMKLAHLWHHLLFLYNSCVHLLLYYIKSDTVNEYTHRPQLQLPDTDPLAFTSTGSLTWKEIMQPASYSWRLTPRPELKWIKPRGTTHLTLTYNGRNRGVQA